MQKRGAIVRLTILTIVIVVGLLAIFLPIRISETYDYVGIAYDIKLGIDLKGGMYAVYGTENEPDKANLTQRLDSTAKRLGDMVRNEGYSEATVVVEGQRIRIEVPDVKDAKKLFELLGEPADMVFEVYDDAEGKTPSANTQTGITGKNILNAHAVQYEAGYAVQLEFDSTGTDKFYNVTKDNVGKFINIKVNGNSVSNAEVKSAIAGGKPVITGSFTQTQADELAKKILSGAFDVKLNLIDHNMISASLGNDALKYSLIAGAIGIILVMIIIGIVYKGLGLAADLALMFYTVLYMIIMWSFPGIQLTLPSIAGIILSISMAVDANVIIFERIKDEYRIGKSVNASITAGFKKSFWTVMDANITTVIASIVLIILGQASVQGFGVTLLIGIIVSIVSALIVSRIAVRSLQKISNDNHKFLGLNRDDDILEIDDTTDQSKNKSTQTVGGQS